MYLLGKVALNYLQHDLLGKVALNYLQHDLLGKVALQPGVGPHLLDGRGHQHIPRIHNIIYRDLLKTRFSRCMSFRHNATIGTD